MKPPHVLLLVALASLPARSVWASTEKAEKEGTEEAEGEHQDHLSLRSITMGEEAPQFWGAVVNGTNWDDRGDYRPGMIAADEHAVRSPLLECQITKAEVRQLAAVWQLPVWDKPASPCLSSRLHYISSTCCCHNNQQTWLCC